MSHLPINHPMRPVYRVVAGLTGAWLMTFGVVGWVETAGGEWFGRGDWTAFGLPTNRAFAMLSIVAGLVVLTAAFVGRNLDRNVNVAGGIVFMVAGTAMMAVINSDLNVLNFSMATVSVSYVIGLVLLAAGLYGKVDAEGAAGGRVGAQHVGGAGTEASAAQPEQAQPSQR